MANYLFNFSEGDRERAAALLRAKMWGIGGDERHRDALAPGDLVLIYVAAPERRFIGHAELASAVHRWTASEAEVYPGDPSSGVLLSHLEEWDPPVPMDPVLAQIDSAENAKADFVAGVVMITAHEYESAVGVSRRTRGT